MTGGIGGDTRDRIVGVERQPMQYSVDHLILRIRSGVSRQNNGENNGGHQIVGFVY